MGKLTNNFTLEELCITSTGLANIPDPAAKEKLLYLATYILQPIRDKFGSVVVSSGYRDSAVNSAIGGVKTSQHRFGEAADIDVLGVNLGMVFSWIRANLKVGQCIDETSPDGKKRWIHVSLPRLGGVNNQFMTYRDGVYKNV